MRYVLLVVVVLAVGACAEIARRLGIPVADVFYHVEIKDPGPVKSPVQKEE